MEPFGPTTGLDVTHFCHWKRHLVTRDVQTLRLCCLNETGKKTEIQRNKSLPKVTELADTDCKLKPKFYSDLALQ